ncbi:MAG: oligosaccharide flippase family protein [Bacteroidales bacterium]
MIVNQLKVGALISYLTLFISNIIGLLYTPFMLQALGQSEFGLYSLVGTVVGYLTILDFGFGSAIVRYGSKFIANSSKDKLSDMLGMFFIIYSVIGVLALLFGSVICFNLDLFFEDSMSVFEIKQAQIMVAILVLNLAFTFPLSIYTSILTIYERFAFQKMVNLVRVILNPIVLVLVLVLGYKAIAMVVVTSIFNIATLIANAIYFKRRINIPIRFKTFDYSFLKEIFQFSALAFILGILDKFYFQFSPFLLGSIIGTVAVSVFSIALQMRGYFSYFSGAISGVFLPRISALINNSKNQVDLTELFIKIGRLQFYIIALLYTGFLLFGKGFILLWAGADYVESYYASTWLLTPFCIALIQNLYYPIAQAMNKQKKLVYIYLVISIITIILSYLLIPRYDVLGAAIAVSSATWIGEIILKNIYFKRSLKIDVIRFWTEMIRPFLVVGLLCLLFHFFNFNVDTWRALLIAIVIYTIIYFVSCFVFLFNNYEKNIVLNSITKIRYVITH